jgi:hypothetical protein
MTSIEDHRFLVETGVAYPEVYLPSILEVDDPTNDEIIDACIPFTHQPVPRNLYEAAKAFPGHIKGQVTSGYFSSVDLSKFYSNAFDRYVAYSEDGQVSEKVRNLVLHKAEDYAKLAPSSRQRYEHRPTAVAWARLAGLISNPQFIVSNTGLGVLEALADLDEDAPFGTVFGVSIGGRKMLNPTITINDLPALEKIVFSDRLWTGESVAMRRIQMPSIATGLVLLAQQHPRETVPVRIEMLKRNTTVPHPEMPYSDISLPIAWSFKTKGEKDLLKEVAKNQTNTKYSQYLQDIADGKYAQWGLA